MEDVELIGTRPVVVVEVVGDDVLDNRVVVVDERMVVVDRNSHENPPSVFLQFWLEAQNGVVDSHSFRSIQFGFFGSFGAKICLRFKNLK